jgi:hypothetical protein
MRRVALHARDTGAGPVGDVRLGDDGRVEVVCSDQRLADALRQLFATPQLTIARMGASAEGVVAVRPGTTEHFEVCCHRLDDFGLVAVPIEPSS